MRFILILLLFPICLEAQIFPSMTMGVQNKPATGGGVSRRVLFDLGGFNTTAAPGDSTISPSGGNYWNNIIGAGTGRYILSTDPVDVTNVPLTGFSIWVNTKPGGSFFPGDSSMNGGGYVEALNDYPVSAVRDNLYVNTAFNMTFVIPAGKQASIKFWGGRNAAGPRILQIKKSTDGAYTQEYEAALNQTYTQGVTFTGITGTTTFNLQPKAGSTFGHISVIDITITDL